MASRSWWPGAFIVVLGGLSGTLGYVLDRRGRLMLAISLLVVLTVGFALLAADTYRRRGSQGGEP